MHDIDVILADCPGLGRVQLCGCNSIHLTIGPVTINLSPDAFVQTATLVRNAMEQFAEILEARQLSVNPVQATQPGRSPVTH